MRPNNIETQIFLDGGDPNETRDVIKMLGFLDGQTTNPTLISRNPRVKEHLERDGRFGGQEIDNFYREIVQELSGIMPEGSISIEVYADRNTTADRMLEQGREFFQWIPNAHIKFPITSEGLKAAERAIRDGMRINMTLCFSQEQAAAVYVATFGAQKGQVFVSPFVGRLDDRGENGMELIGNILKMYKQGDGHVEVLTASVRNIEHFLYALAMKSDIISAPAKVLYEWVKVGMPVPGPNFQYDAGNLKSISYQEIELNKPWQQYSIVHDLTDMGLERFSADWNALIS